MAIEGGVFVCEYMPSDEQHILNLMDFYAGLQPTKDRQYNQHGCLHVHIVFYIITAVG